MLNAIVPALVLVVAQANGELPKPEDVERAALEQRRAITSWQATLERTKFQGEATTSETFLRVHYWAEGDKSRFDITRYKGGTVDLRWIQCLNCEHDGAYIHYAFSKHPGLPLALPICKTTPETKDHAGMLVDLRLVGLIPEGTSSLRHYNLHSYLLSADRSDLTVARAVWQGLPCWVVRYKKKAGNRIEMWIVPQRAHSVVRVKDSILWEGVFHESMIDSDLKQWGEKKVWYPSRCVATKHQDGKLVEREVTDVRDATFNEPFPPDTFTLAGLELQSGTLIDDRITGLLFQWFRDGKRVDAVKKPDKEIDLPEKLPAEPDRRRTWCVGLSIAFGVCGASAVAWGWWRPAKKTAPRIDVSPGSAAITEGR